MVQLYFSNSFKGRISKVLEMRSGVSAKTGNEWTTQQYILEEVGNAHPQKIIFEVADKDKINLFNLHENDYVEVSIDFSTTYYQDKPYNRVRAWNVVHLGNGEQNPAPAPSNPVIMQDRGQGGMSPAQQAQTIMQGQAPQPMQNLQNMFNAEPEEGGIPF